jgi:ABC-2 type transport system permease protein
MTVTVDDRNTHRDNGTGDTGTGPLEVRPIRLSRVLRSEWIKLVTLRSTWLMVVAIAAAVIGIGLVSAAVATPAAAGDAPHPGGGFGDPVTMILNGSSLALLIVGVLGVAAGTREHATGMIRTTLAAVPARLPVLWAKLLAFAGIVFPAALVSVVIAYPAGVAMLRDGVTAPPPTDGGVVRALLGTALYLTAVGVIGLALGMLLRGLGIGIGVLLGGVLVLPPIATALLPDSWSAVLKYLPSNAGAAFSHYTRSADLLAPAAGGIVLAVWVVLAVSGSAFALRERDV